MVPSLLVIFIIFMHFACVYLEQEKVGDSLKSLEGTECLLALQVTHVSVTEGIWEERRRKEKLYRLKGSDTFVL